MLLATAPLDVSPLVVGLLLGTAHWAFCLAAKISRDLALTKLRRMGTVDCGVLLRNATSFVELVVLFTDDMRLLLVAVVVVVVDPEAGECSLLDNRLPDGWRRRLAFKLFARTVALKRTSDSWDTDLFEREDFIELCIDPPSESTERSTSEAVLIVHWGPLADTCFTGDARLSLDMSDFVASANRLLSASLEFLVELSSLDDIFTTGSISLLGGSGFGSTARGRISLMGLVLVGGLFSDCDRR